MKTTAPKENSDNKTHKEFCASDYQKSTFDAKQLATYILNGAVGVIETDTIYGMIGSAFYPDVVNRIYQIKHRNINKPFIILVSDIRHVEYFGVTINKDLLHQIRKFWPGPYSIIMQIDNPEKFDYLTRGGNSLCFRMPDMPHLLELIDIAGPIVAPSANPEDKEPAKTIEEAYKYFEDKVDFYSDGGYINRSPSKIIKIENGELIELRS